jgi:hypothetical protein
MNVNSKALRALESRTKLRQPDVAPAETFAYGAHREVGVLLREAAIPLPGRAWDKAPGKPGGEGQNPAYL